MINHTPGPWKPVMLSRTPFIQAPRRHPLAQHDTDICRMHNDDLPAGELDANVRLIAAAPELLQMLIALSTEATEWGAASNNCKVMREARVLLAKVVGEK